MGVALSEAEIARILTEAETDLACYVTADGELAFDMSAHVVSFSKP